MKNCHFGTEQINKHGRSLIWNRMKIIYFGMVAGTAQPHILWPRPHVSGDFCIRKFFYADTPSVHTCPPYTLVVSGDFCIRSPEWKFLYTLCIRIRVDARIRIFLYTLTSQYQNQSFPREIFLRCWLILWDIRIRIGYVWTVVYDSYTLRVDADIFVSA